MAHSLIVRASSRFARDETGSFSIETMIWIPLFAVVFAFVTDVSLTYYGYSRMWDVARDSVRRVTTGEMTTAEAEAHARSILTGGAVYSVTVDDTDTEDVVITITASGLSPLFGSLEFFSPGLLSTVYTMRKEGVGAPEPPAT